MKKGVVDIVLSKLPPPDKLKGKSGGGYAPASDDEAEDSVGEQSAFEDFIAAMGVKPKDADEARRALADYVSMCVARRLEGDSREGE